MKSTDTTTTSSTIPAPPSEMPVLQDTAAARPGAFTAIPDPPQGQAPSEESSSGRRPNALRMVLASNSPALTPWRWMVAADVTACTAHYATPSLWWAAVTAVGASTAAAGWAMWRTREARLSKKIKTVKNRHKVRANAKTAVAAGSVWVLVGSVWTPIGPHAGMQFTLLGGTLLIAAPHWYRNRRRDLPPEPEEPVAELPPPAEDPRLVTFRIHFCVQGTLDGARIHDFTEVPGGFRFHIELPLDRRVTFNHVKQLEDEIAALYDVPYDQVSVEPPESRSARRAVITVLTATKAHEREEHWDGTSTYNPETGCIDLGRYADSTTSHWQLHAPYSGACSGIVVGVQGAGKTGTLHVVSSETGLARLCTVCLAQRSCEQCDLQRISALWMGDPQKQGFAVWHGRADLTAWGPVSCVRMLSWMHASMRHRADYLGRMEWTDHLGRRNVGKGWFDPTPQFPQITAVIDEWPILSSDPDLGPYAVPLALDILREGRKVGFALILGSQEADVDVLGDRGVRQLLRAFNACVHRSDRLAKQMLAIDGNPEDLPDGLHGVSYLKSIDQRSGIVHRTKHLPEYLKPGQTGVDVRAIADRIAASPVTYDEAVMRALRPLGYTGPRQVLSDDDDWDISALLLASEAEEDKGAQPNGSTPPASPGPDVTAAPYTAVVQRALQQSPHADVYELMQITGLSALEVQQAVNVLVASGHAVRGADGTFTTHN